MLLPLHRPSGTPVWVNPDHIVTMSPADRVVNDGESTLHLTPTGEWRGTLHTLETPDEILAMLGLPGETLPPKHEFPTLDEGQYLRGER